MPKAPAASFLDSYIAARHNKIMEDRSSEDLSRQMKLTALYHTIDNADKLGLGEDHLKELYNQVGEALGHKPDPKLFGILGVGDKGSKGIEGLGDLLYSVQNRDKQTPIKSVGGGPPDSPEDQSAVGMGSNVRQLGPPPEMIQTQRHGSIPIADLQAQRQIATKQALDTHATNENIRQGVDLSKGQIIKDYDANGNLVYRQYDPIKKVMKIIPTEGGNKDISTINKEVGAEGAANKDFLTHLNLINQDPNWKDQPEPVKRTEAARRVNEQKAAELGKTIARTKELEASTSLKRAREHYLSVPTPEQNRNFIQRQQGVEIRQTQLAINQGVFNKKDSINLVRDLKDFQTSNAAAMKTIEEGNQASATFKTSANPADQAKAVAKWREGYAKLAQAKVKAELMRSQYPGMVNVAGTDPSDTSQFPWVEANYEAPSTSNNNSSNGGSQKGKKRSFNPSPTTNRPSKEQYIEALKGKGLSQEQIDAKVKQYY